MSFIHNQTVKLPNGMLVHVEYDATGKIVKKKSTELIAKKIQNPTKYHSKDKGGNKMEENVVSKDAHQLNTFIDRIERLEEEKRELSADIREVFSEAKGAGFDVKVMRQVLRLRKMDPADRAETEFLRDEYKKLLGMTE